MAVVFVRLTSLSWCGCPASVNLTISPLASAWVTEAERAPLSYVFAPPPPPPPPPTLVPELLEDDAPLAVTATVFVIASAFEGAIVIVRVWEPAEAEGETAMVQLMPALWPPEMSEGEQPEDMEKMLGDTVMEPNRADVSPLFTMLRLRENVDPMVALAELGEAVADTDGGVITLNVPDVAVSGLPWPLIETDMVWLLSFWEITAVVHETDPLPLVVLVKLSPVRLKPAGYDVIMAWAFAVAPETEIVKALPCMTELGSAPDCETVTLAAAETNGVSTKTAARRIRNFFIFSLRTPPRRTTSHTSHSLMGPVCLP